MVKIKSPICLLFKPASASRERTHIFFICFQLLSDVEWPIDKGNWAGLKSLGMVESTKKINGEGGHEKRLAFPTVKALNLPIGSGAIESSIRRVVNLRLKGPCTFGYRENVETLIMLRSYYKSVRWNYLKQIAKSQFIRSCITVKMGMRWVEI